MGSVVSAHPDRLRQCGQALAAALASYVILLCPPPAQPSPVLEEQLSPVRPGLIIETDAYTKTLESRHNRTKGITTDTDANEYMMSAHAEEMFTHDAWLGMQRLVRYGRYVDSLEVLEAEEDCFQCKANREVLEHAWQVVANEFYDPFDHFSQSRWAGELQKTLQANGGALKTKRALYKAAKSMIGSLDDQYSMYLEPSAFRAAIRKPTKAERDYLSEQAVGVGMRLGGITRGYGRVVTATMPGSTAEAAGIRIGDVVMSFEGLPTSGLNEAQLAQQMRGPVGSSLNVVVERNRPWQSGSSSTEKSSIALVRQPLPQVAAASKLVQDSNTPAHLAQYIRINYFSSDATQSVMKAIVEGELAGVDGYIIDLRNNPGGVFEEAIAISQYFLDSDGDGHDTHIVETVRNNDATSRRNIIDNVWTVGLLPSDVFPRRGWGLTTRPVAMITNSGTASASEVMAGALQDNQRGEVVGERTFGKGVVQYFFRMEDGSGIKLTVAKYLTPNYHDVAVDGGIRPDVSCHDTPHSVLPGRELDACIRSAMRYVSSNSGGGAHGLLASR